MQRPAQTRLHALITCLILAGCGKSEPAPLAADAPPTTTESLQSCLQDFDCVLYEREVACFGRGNMAVRRDELEAARAAFPPKAPPPLGTPPLECGTGPESMTRPEAGCEEQRCVVRFVGVAAAPTDADVIVAPEAGADGEAPVASPGRRYPAGSVPTDLIATLAPAPDRATPMALLEGCNTPAAIDDERCIGMLEVGLVGVRGDGMAAFITAPAMGGCSEFVETSGLVGSLPELARPEKKSLGSSDDDDAARWASAWGFIAELQKTGFAAPTQLIAKTTLAAPDPRGGAPLVALRAPLDGWLVYATSGDKGVDVHLVPPDNGRGDVLGNLPIVTPPCPSPEDREAGLCEPFKEPSLLQVALSPDQTHLVVTLTLGDGSQCGSDKVYHRAWPLPAGVTLDP